MMGAPSLRTLSTDVDRGVSSADFVSEPSVTTNNTLKPSERDRVFRPDDGEFLIGMGGQRLFATGTILQLHIVMNY